MKTKQLLVCYQVCPDKDLYPNVKIITSKIVIFKKDKKWIKLDSYAKIERLRTLIKGCEEILSITKLHKL